MSLTTITHEIPPSLEQRKPLTIYGTNSAQKNMKPNSI